MSLKLVKLAENFNGIYTNELHRFNFFLFGFCMISIPKNKDIVKV